MNKIWSDDAWEDYLYWQSQDKKTLKRINQLIQDIERNGCAIGIGKPEILTGDLQGEFSRRINDKDRLVYHVENGKLFIAHCRGHYGDKLRIRDSRQRILTGICFRNRQYLPGPPQKHASPFKICAAKQRTGQSRRRHGDYSRGEETSFPVARNFPICGQICGQ